MPVARPAGPPPTMMTSASFDSNALSSVTGHDPAGAPLVLRSVEGLVRARNELGLGREGELGRRHTERRGDGGQSLVALRARPMRDRLPDTLRDEPSRGRGRLRREHDELLAA